jgi:hypothetical protein
MRIFACGRNYEKYLCEYLEKYQKKSCGIEVFFRITNYVIRVTFESILEKCYWDTRIDTNFHVKRVIIDIVTLFCNLFYLVLFLRNSDAINSNMNNNLREEIQWPWSLMSVVSVYLFIQNFINISCWMYFILSQFQLHVYEKL